MTGAVNGAELLPCPFCGGTAQWNKNDGVTAIDSDAGAEWIDCPRCGASTNQRYSLMEDCKPLLAEQWNRRASLGAAQVPAVNRETVVEWLDANDIEVTDRQLNGLFSAAAAQMPDLTKTRGYHALIQVIYELRSDGQYSDDEGEETDALADLVAAIECGREKSGAVSDMRDRLLAALERAVKAETELRVLKDSAGAAQVPSLSTAVAKQAACLAFFASVIKSGEPWTDACQRMYDEAKAAVAQQGAAQ